jgi:hypothetical protein
MPFDWKTLIDIAEMLARVHQGTPLEEAAQRSAVSRAYFGAFGHAFSYATRFLNYDPKENPEDHGRLREHLRRKKRAGAAKSLGRLRVLRNEADYLDELPWDRAFGVKTAIQLAREIVRHLPPPQPQKTGP